LAGNPMSMRLARSRSTMPTALCSPRRDAISASRAQVVWIGPRFALSAPGPTGACCAILYAAPLRRRRPARVESVTSLVRPQRDVRNQADRIKSGLGRPRPFTPLKLAGGVQDSRGAADRSALGAHLIDCSREAIASALGQRLNRRLIYSISTGIARNRPCSVARPGGNAGRKLSFRDSRIFGGRQPEFDGEGMAPHPRPSHDRLDQVVPGMQQDAGDRRRGSIDQSAASL